MHNKSFYHNETLDILLLHLINIQKFFKKDAAALRHMIQYTFVLCHFLR